MGKNCGNCKHADVDANKEPCSGCSTTDEKWEPKIEDMYPGNAPNIKNQRGKILVEALQTINGERQDQYGDPEDSFNGIAMQWSRYLFSKYPDMTELDAADVAHMMILFKLERELNKPKRDNLLDLCGYAAIKADILEKSETEGK